MKILIDKDGILYLYSAVCFCFTVSEFCGGSDGCVEVVGYGGGVLDWRNMSHCFPS